MQGMDAQQVNVDVGNRVHFIGNCEASKTPSKVPIPSVRLLVLLSNDQRPTFQVPKAIYRTESDGGTSLSLSANRCGAMAIRADLASLSPYLSCIQRMRIACESYLSRNRLCLVFTLVVRSTTTTTTTPPPEQA